MQQQMRERLIHMPTYGVHVVMQGRIGHAGKNEKETNNQMDEEGSSPYAWTPVP